MSTLPFIHKVDFDVSDCSFSYPYTTESNTPLNLKKSNIFVNIPAATTPVSEHVTNYHIDGEYERGWVAIKLTIGRHWAIADATVSKRRVGESNYLTVHANDIRGGCDEVAIGIDTRMTREDIDGATIIYKNKAGTGWLFAHATEEEHHDRILLAETAISTVFEELLMDRLIRMDVIDIAGRSTSNRRGELTILAHINSFRNDCMKMARYLEGQLHIGQHVKEPEKHYIYKMVENAFALAEKKWKAEKSAELNQISDRIAGIKKRLSSRHTFKRRWEIPTVFPNAARTETETESE